MNIQVPGCLLNNQVKLMLTPFVVFCADEQTRAEDTRAYVNCSLPGRIMRVAVLGQDGACSSHQSRITNAHVFRIKYQLPGITSGLL